MHILVPMGGSLVGQPLHTRGRAWSTLHCGFVNVCHDFLGVLTTNDAHRCTVPPCAGHTLYYSCLPTAECATQTHHAKLIRSPPPPPPKLERNSSLVLGGELFIVL